MEMAGPTLSTILTIIFNESITEGIFPTALKVAKVVPIHKGESIFEVSNYRPISLLPIFAKILEKLMFTRLNDFIQKQNIIYQNQFGCQKNKSTELAVHSIISNIVKSFEDKENVYCISLDFAMAFDTGDHKILLKKLKYLTCIGIRGVLFKFKFARLKFAHQKLIFAQF